MRRRKYIFMFIISLCFLGLFSQWISEPNIAINSEGNIPQYFTKKVGLSGEYTVFYIDPLKTLLGMFTILIGLLMVVAPSISWYVYKGRKYRNIYPSVFLLKLNQMSGSALLLIGFILLAF